MEPIRILIDTTHVFNPFVPIFKSPSVFSTRNPTGFRISDAFLRVLLIGLVWIGTFAPVTGIAETETTQKKGLYKGFKAEGDIRRFEGEQLLFDISFMFFDNAATAHVRFYEKDGRYFSTLKAETKGFVGFVTSQRKHFYKATFDVSKDGRRVLTRKFEREVKIGDDVEKTTHYLDYTNRKHFWFKYNNDKLTEQETEVIPEGKFYDDILASFYNFRNGVYGPLIKGRRYKIDTIPDKSMKDISVYILPEAEEKKIREEQDRPKGDEYLLNVVIPKEIFKTDTGELLFWGSRHFVPLETKVLNYVLLGDLHVKLSKRVQN
ncbi:MAG: DUF3108 domain-containing protein [Candidatus Nitronauta litoralis]|uniref:DUF3108 domain-containing protein n=1 Tax=Candidatus Nitronauta litoralis TaxID=2705533 RepID=A0A7T0BYC4_9BACT|nr:MAG: DUF3108 domain-containing protein [Candidatus Nitronauta litoralis]